MLRSSLGEIDCMDRFIQNPNSPDRSYRAYPRGVTIHWIAGNVPSLGILSLVPGILTKNFNILRVPSSANTLLADLIGEFASLSDIAFRIAEAVVVVRYPWQEQSKTQVLCKMADTRVIWGGDESCRTVKAISSKPTCFEMVFPDRTSFVIIAKSQLDPQNFPRIARLIAHDASVFEQKACASPHTIFLDTDRDEDISAFAGVLRDAMKQVLKSIPKSTPSQQEVSAILNLRSQFDMFHEAWYSGGTEFTILADNEMKLGPPIGNRTLYLRKLSDLEALASIIPENIQTVGIAAEEREFEQITTALGKAGVLRFTALGGMTQFELPWDGVQIPQHLVRWTYRPAGPPSNTAPK